VVQDLIVVGGGSNMYDARQNMNAYTEHFEIYKQTKKTNSDKSRLKYSNVSHGVIVAKIYRNYEQEGLDENGFRFSNTNVIIKTPDLNDIKVDDKLIHLETNKSYIVVSITYDIGKSKFRGRYDNLKTGVSYISLRGLK